MQYVSVLNLTVTPSKQKIEITWVITVLSGYVFKNRPIPLPPPTV